MQKRNPDDSGLLIKAYFIFPWNRNLRHSCRTASAAYYSSWIFLPMRPALLLGCYHHLRKTMRVRRSQHQTYWVASEVHCSSGIFLPMRPALLSGCYHHLRKTMRVRRSQHQTYWVASEVHCSSGTSGMHCPVRRFLYHPQKTRHVHRNRRSMNWMGAGMHCSS